MSAINTGGPAFPLQHEDEKGLVSSFGMTLRDYFAAKALSALLTNEAIQTHEGERMALFAELAYKLADAMIAEREKGGAA